MKKDIKEFIKKILIVSFPIILQELLANLSSLIDTIMVGQLTNSSSISGVYIATQILFIVNLLIYGSIEGASIFFCQYYGINDEKGMQKAFGFKLISCLFVSILSMLILFTFGNNFIALFTDNPETHKIALDYLNIVNISIVPFALATTLSATIREYHKKYIPLITTLIGVFVNIIMNYLFIFGIGFFPRLEGTGAALGTLIERFVRLIILLVIVYKNKYAFSKDILQCFKIEKDLFKKILIKSIPLLFNEFLWGFLQTLLVFFFKEKSSVATNVLPIVSNFSNIIFVSLLGLGNGYSIVIGNVIGQNKLKKAQLGAYTSLIISLISCVFLGTIMFIFSPSIVSIFKAVEGNDLITANTLLKYCSFYLLINGINTTLFFLLRAGGKTGVVFLFDCVFGYFITLPLSIIICYLTPLNFVSMYMIIYSVDLLKTILGFILLLSKKWCKNLTNHNEEKALA